MINQIISISMAEADAFAMEYFMSICGLNRDGEKYQRMLKQGMNMKEIISRKLDIRAIVSSFSGETIQNNKATLNGITFECNAFQRMDPKHIHGVYAYILTAGALEIEDDAPILDQLYADIWGTSYVDSGLEVFKKAYRKGFGGRKC